MELSDLILDDDYQGALRLLRGAHADAPDRDNVTHALASALRDAGRELHADGSYKTAIALYEEGSKLLPDDWEFPLDSARVYFDQRTPAHARLQTATSAGSRRPPGASGCRSSSATS